MLRFGVVLVSKNQYLLRVCLNLRRGFQTLEGSTSAGGPLVDHKAGPLLEPAPVFGRQHARKETRIQSRRDANGK
jgi:hypothetical protein